MSLAVDLDRIENRTFDELKVGDSASISRTLTQKDIELFAIMSGDVNPAHVDEEFAKSDMFHKIIAHGMWGGALISTVLGTQLPGPGAIYLAQSLRFLRPVGLGDTIVVTAKVSEKNADKHRVTLECQAVNQNGEVVISGTAEVIAPTEKISRERVTLPEIKLLEKGRHFRQLIEMSLGLFPIVTAVVHPADTASLQAAREAAEANLIVPVLVGPEAKISAAAEQAHVDISQFEKVYTDHSHQAAERAVLMAREHRVEALMKGSLHTDELMHFVDAQHGLQTARRMSHVSAMEVPGFPRLLFISDTALNVSPTVTDKRDIVQNAIDLAHAFGLEEPKVAVLSAQESVSPRLKSSFDAAVLCKMADRGQITGGVLDGPLGYDAAVSAAAAGAKRLVSPVAGNADILVVQDVEAGTMLVKQLQYMSDAEVAEVVIGARVPVILTNRSSSMLARLASCVLALLSVRHSQAKQSSSGPAGFDDYLT
jgi:phosphate acetyltransferase/phosphate butyryltransferase